MTSNDFDQALLHLFDIVEQEEEEQLEKKRKECTLLFSSISKDQRQAVQQGRATTPFLTLATEWVEYVIMEDETNNKNRKKMGLNNLASTRQRSSKPWMAALTSRLYQKVLVAPTGPLPTVACTLLVALSWIAVRQSALLLATAALTWVPASSSSMAALSLLS